MIESLVGNKEYEKVKNIINESIEKAEIKDIELSRKIIGDNIEKIKNLSNAYIGIIGLIDSDKTFESVVNITKEQLIKYLPQEKISKRRENIWI